MLNELQKTVLITGSAVRIGKYIAKFLANDGWKIALHYHDSEEQAYQLANELLPLADIMLFKANLKQAEQACTLIERVNKQLGPVTLLINNASSYQNDNLANLNNELLEQNLNLHVQAPLFLAQAMGKQEISGNIINIIDADICHNKKDFFSYSLSKKALFTLTQLLAVNLAPYIRVNAIAPGPILFKEGQNLEVFQRLIDESPLKVNPSLDELCETIRFLISNRSITGQCIFLDSGRHLL